MKFVVLTEAGNRLYNTVSAVAAALRHELLAEVDSGKLSACSPTCLRVCKGCLNQPHEWIYVSALSATLAACRLGICGKQKDAEGGYKTFW